MGRKSRTSVLKRQREVKKQEKAALKQALKQDKPRAEEENVDQVATQDDLAGYGLGPEPEEDAPQE